MQHVFHPQYNPIRGLFSYPDKSSLGPGEFSRIDGWRWCGIGTPKSRNGCASVVDASGLPVGSTPLGASEPIPWGSVVLLFCATNESGTVKIWWQRRTSGTWETDWVECTAASGKYNNSRMSVPTFGPVTFLPVTGRNGTEGVIVQDGTSSARWIDFDDLTGGARIVSALAAPTELRQTNPLADLSATFDVTTTGTFTSPGTETGTTFNTPTQTNASWSYGYYLSLTRTAAASVNGDTCEIVLASGSKDGSGAKQVIFLLETSDDTWFSECSWELRRSGGTYVKVHDLSASPAINTFHEVYPTRATNVRMVAMAIPPDATVTDINGIRITSKTTTMTASATLKIYWIAFGGKAPGQCEYAVSYRSSVTMAESGAVILAAGDASLNTANLRSVATNGVWVANERDPYGEKVFRASGAGLQVKGASVPPDYVLPIDPEIYYYYRVPIKAPTSAQLSTNHADTMDVWRKDPGESDFKFAFSVTVGQFDSGADNRWETNVTYFSGQQAWSERTTTPDTVASEDLVQSRTAPDLYNEQFPIGQAMIQGNKRTYATKVRGTSNDKAQNLLMASQPDEPHRFRTYVKLEGQVADPNSGFSVPCRAENIRALFDVSASFIGTERIYPLTDFSAYALNGYSLNRIGSTGCAAPLTVSENDGRAQWLDVQNVWRYMVDVPTDISSTTVQDVLDAIPATRRKWASGIVFRNHLYLAHASASSDNNHKVSVFCTQFRDAEGNLQAAHEACDTYPVTVCPQFFIPWNVEGEAKVYFMAPDLVVYEFEKSGQLTDSGTAITLGLTTGEVHDPEWQKRVVAKRQGVVATAGDYEFTTGRLCRPGLATSVGGTIRMASPTDDRGWRMDEMGKADDGQSVELTLDASVTVAVTLYAWASELEGADLHGPSS